MRRYLLACFMLMWVAEAGPASAQNANTAPAPANPSTSRARGGPTDNQIGDQVDARIAKLKADLRLTPDQDRDWPGLQGTLHNFGVDQTKRRFQSMFERESRRGARNRGGAERDDAASDDIDRLRQEADGLTARAFNLRKIADAADPIYKTMDATQRRELVRYMRDSFSRAE